MKTIATNDDRALSNFIEMVRIECKRAGGNDDQIFACMPSIMAEYRDSGLNPSSAVAIAMEIAEHG